MRKVSYALLALAACGSARIIQMTPNGGIIELHDDRSKAMEQAMHDMNAKCGANNFTIVKEGYDPIGVGMEQDPATATSNGSDSGHTEWRIHFQCNGVTTSPPPSDLPPGPPSPNQPPPMPPPADPNAGAPPIGL